MQGIIKYFKAIGQTSIYYYRLNLVIQLSTISTNEQLQRKT